MTRQALHITNGDSTAGTLLETPLVERVLPWRDVLHDGPVPAVADDELRRIRATFLAEDASQDATAIERWLEERDKTLTASAAGELVLWFEADLYDQLQLIQVSQLRFEDRDNLGCLHATASDVDHVQVRVGVSLLILILHLRLA